MNALPIDAVLDQLVATVAGHPLTVLRAPPGAGKTTRVPLALLDAGRFPGRILMLEPRRLAARSAAAYMAEQRAETVGQTVGYRVRFDTRVSAATRIEVITEGVLTRMLQSDPELDGVSVVVFDEFHERALQADLGLALCREIQNALRPDLRLLIMSATLEDDLADTLAAPLVTTLGRAYPVTVDYLDAEPTARPEDTVAAAVVDALPRHPGDVLVFLPGVPEIRRVMSRLQGRLDGSIDIAALYGDLPLDAQRDLIAAHGDGRRRVILATTIAETSVTVPGVRLVIDSGWTRRQRLDPRTGMDRLVTERVTLDAADQRSGRAGRTAAGTALRLWTRRTHQGLDACRPPEITHVDLTALALELAQWGSDELPWLTPPPPAALTAARTVLTLLGAIDDAGRISEHGRAMARIPAHPRLAHMMLASDTADRATACDLSALLENRDLRPEGGGADISSRLALLSQRTDMPGLATVRRSAERLRRQVHASGPAHAEACGRLLALAYPDRIARRREHGDGRYLLSSGRGAALPPADNLARAQWLVAADVDDRGDEGRIRLAAVVPTDDLADIVRHQGSTGIELTWDSARNAVAARDETRIGAIIVHSRPVPLPENAPVVDVFLQGLTGLGAAALPWTPALRQWQARVQCAAEWLPEHHWPEVGDDALTNTLSDWLGPYLAGITRLSDLPAAVLGDALHAMLSWTQRSLLDAELPTRLTVPSGHAITLDYKAGEAPVLAVKLQAVFGLDRTPTVASGRQPVTLHLLSPAGRPVQVTQDLAGFWARTYPEVARELKGRYPRHPWPDDPTQAQATMAAKRRGR